MSANSFFYFAYGSNMLSARLQALKRCPGARPLGVAELRGHELRWHKRSKKDGSGKCDIVPSQQSDDSVFGVLYEIADSERPALDREEGCNNGYAAVEVMVQFKGGARNARSYQATDTNSALRPYTWYRALVVAGATEHGLPAEYIARLGAVSADLDSDRKRHEENMALIGKVSA